MKNRFLPFACLASLLLPVATFGNVGNHSLFIKTDGSLWGMGLNSSGQLGNGTNSAVTTPQKMVDANSTNPIVEVSTGATHTLFIRKDGSLWGMGGNNRGQLGDGNLTDRNTPVRIVSSGVASCSSGYYHSLFIKADGSLWGMGDNFCGQLGIDVAGGSSGGFDEGIDKKTPVQILSSGVNQASAGKNFSVFVKSDGSLWGMGESHLGRLGRDWDGGANDTFNAAYDHKVPVRIMESEVIEVEAGAQFTLVRKMDGSAWSFGDNWKGQLADGNRPVNNKDPYRFLDANVTQISASWSFGAALLENGSLLTFGGNNVGQLGDGTNVDRNQSVEVFSSGINQVATGIGHTMILKTDGSLWTVGTNRFGQLGTGQSGGGNNSFDEGIDEKTPVQVVASGVHRLINVQANAAPNFHPNHPILEVAENRPVGTIVGEFNATDTDANATLTYSLVDGNGSTHNNLFTLDANGTLKTNATFDYETKASAHSIRVQVKDEHNFTKEKVFTVNITDTNEAPNLGAGAGSFALSIPESSNPVSIPATWDRTFGGTGVDKLAVTIKTSDGGYLLTGTSDSNASAEKSENSRGGKDYWLVKVDPSGNKVWDRTFGGSEEDLCYGATEVSGGGYLVYGTSLSPADGDRSAQNKGNQDFWIVRIDANGNKLWDKAYGGNGHDNCYDVIQTDDGGYLLGGRSNSSAGGDVGEAGRGEVDYWIVKIDANGNKLWDKRYGGGGWDGFWRILSIPGGGYLLGGSSTSNASGEKSENKQGRSDYWVVRIDANGSKLWDKTYGGTGDDWISGMTLTNDAGFLLTAYSDSNASGDKSEGSENTLNYWMVRIDANGSKLWDKTLISQSGSHSKDLIATDDGNYIVLGLAWASGEGGDRSHPTYGKADFWAVKIDDEGNKLWDKNFGGSGGDFGQSVIPTDDEGYLFTGHAWTGISFDKSEACRGNYDYWVVKTDADGNRNHFATDPDGDTLAWSISGGTDASKFTINAATGELTLNSSDYENPTDADGNNTYEVELTVTDPDNLTASKQVTINVTDVNDAPEIAQGAGPITFTIPEDAGVVSWSPWDKTFGGSFGDACNDVIATVDGGYLLVGDSNSTNDGDRSEGSRGGRDFWAVKIDASGAKVWDKRYGGSGNDLCRDVIATSDGGYLLAGWSDSPANGDKSEASRGHGDYWIVKIDENGTKLWDKRYGGTGWDYCCSVTATTDFTVNVPDAEDAVYAELRVGISRPSSAGRAVAISLNGQELNVSEEDAAERIDNGKDYATCKIIRIPSGLIKTANTVAVTFPDGGEGAVGAVVIRAAFEK